MSKLKRPASSRVSARRWFGGSVTLAVLVDRGGRELPIEPAAAAARVTLPPNQRLALTRDEAGRFSFDIETV